jgi:peptidoglycan/LPS O-acetylase OafA/YrhL
VDEQRVPDKHERYRQLDALRGLAALTVVFNHLAMTRPRAAGLTPVHGIWPALLKWTPLHVLWAGHEAVLFFFVLSGFVLSLPWHVGRPESYGRFLVKRVCRIWLPYIAIMAFALAARLSFSGYGRSQLSTAWARSAWQGVLTPARLLLHASLIGTFPGKELDPVVWSLTIEMRVSLVFPLLVLLAYKGGARITLAVGAAIGIVGYGMQQVGVAPDLGRTLVYVPVFLLGILLAQHREAVRAVTRRIAHRVGMTTILVAGLLLYSWPWWALPQFSLLHAGPPDDWATTAGAACFIAVALAAPRCQAALERPVTLWLGRISYSLYLIHAVVLLSLLHAVAGRFPCHSSGAPPSRYLWACPISRTASSSAPRSSSAAA